VTRRNLISALAPACLAPVWFSCGEPHWFEVSHTRISIPGVRPTRILHLADLHVSDGMTAADLEPGLRAGLDERPDLICITGDFVSNPAGFDRAGLLRLLRLAADTAPTYAVAGNHDGGAWLARRGGARSSQFMRELVATAGVHVLHNASVEFGDLTLAGVGDLWSGETDPDRAFTGVDPDSTTIALCHNPDGKAILKDYHWHLMLSGHTHGGQVRIPGITPLWAPVWDKRFVAGLYTWEQRHLFITRGLGSPKHVRAFCRPEVSVLEVG